MMVEQAQLTQQDYNKLIVSAYLLGRHKLAMVILMLGSTDIRVCELGSVTVEAVHEGRLTVKRASRVHTVYIPKTLKGYLLNYCTQSGIAEGVVFRNRNGTPLSGRWVWYACKQLAFKCDIDAALASPRSIRQCRTEFNGTRLLDMAMTMERRAFYAREKL